MGTLAVLFWAYFMYFWRTWDTKRDPNAAYDTAQAEYDEQFELVYGHVDRARARGEDPHAIPHLEHSRRKSHNVHHHHRVTSPPTAEAAAPAASKQQQQQRRDSNGSARRASVSFAVAKVSDDGEDRISVDISTRQVARKCWRTPRWTSPQRIWRTSGSESEFTG